SSAAGSGSGADRCPPADTQGSLSGPERGERKAQLTLQLHSEIWCLSVCMLTLVFTRRGDCCFYHSVCVCACVRACVCECVCECVCVCVCVCTYGFQCSFEIR